MTTSYNELIQVALKNYRQGLQQPKQIRLKNPGDSIKQKAHEIIKSRLSLKEQLVMSQFTIALNQGLAAARNNQFISAEKFFAELHRHLSSKTLSTEGNLICQSFQEAAEAYFDYRQHNFEDAQKHTLKALDIDILLEEDYGYDKSVIHAHRLEMVINLTRIHFRAMNVEQAMELASCTLSYLQGILPVLPFPGEWSPELVALLPSELVKFHLETITREIALILVDKNCQANHELFKIAARYMLSENDRYCHDYSAIHAWFVVKEAFLKKDIVAFLERASQFLIEGYTSNTQLWYAVVVDLVILCDELTFSDRHLVKQEIANDAIEWQDCPEIFRSSIGCVANGLCLHSI